MDINNQAHNYPLHPQQNYPQAQINNAQPSQIYEPFDTQMHSSRLIRVRLIEYSLDSGCFFCFKVILFLTIISSIFQILAVFGNYVWSDIIVGVIAIWASVLTIQAMKNRITIKAHKAFILVLVQVFPMIISLILNYIYLERSNTMPDEEDFAVEFPILVLLSIMFHFGINVYGTYSVREILKERDQLIQEERDSGIQNYMI